MNFKITNELIDTIKPYIENATVTISSDNKDWKGRDYKSDFVTIDANNNVGFEVLENEIIVFYFTDHCHFEDYSSELQDGEDDYAQRAKKFLIDLFTNEIRYVSVYKGKKLFCEKYYFACPDGTIERIGGTWWGFAKFLNPFAKKIENTTVYKYDKANQTFKRIIEKNNE